MAQQQLKKLKYDGKEVVVEVANRDGSGNIITSTYQKKITAGTGLTMANDGYTLNLDQASASALGGIKLGTGLTYNSTTGQVDVTSAAWSGLTNKPFDSLKSEDFTVSSTVLAINTTNWGDKTWVTDNFLSINTILPATNVIPSTNTANKILLSTSTHKTAAWSHGNFSSSNIKPLYLDSSGVLSAGKTYAGGTAVTLNGTSKAENTASFYAPTSGGTAKTILVGTGTTSAPVWSANQTWDGAEGFLKIDTFGVASIDTNTYLTQHQSLANYYTKSEIDASLSGIHQFEYQTASELPTASASTMYKIYIVPATNSATNNVKDEFITIRSGSEGSYTYSWEQIGSTVMDLSGYATETDATLKVTTSTLLSSLQENKVYTLSYNTDSYDYTVIVARHTATLFSAYDLNHGKLYSLHGNPGNTTVGGLIGSSPTWQAQQSISISGSGLQKNGSMLSLKPATTSALGGVIVSTGLSVDSSGNLTLNTASASALGGIKIGDGLSISDGVVSVASAPSAINATNATNATNWTNNPFTVTDVTLDY